LPDSFARDEKYYITPYWVNVYWRKDLQKIYYGYGFRQRETAVASAAKIRARSPCLYRIRIIPKVGAAL